MFLEEGVDDGGGAPERNWRGVCSAEGSSFATTDLLYATPQEACLAAVELHDDQTGVA
jgi:hypothetical protein